MDSAHSSVPKTMRAARLHAMGEDLRIDELAVPPVRPTDVLVEVKACGVVPNLKRVISNYFGTQTPDAKVYPPLPAIFGLDPAGVIAAVGEQVTGVKPGERVYVNPARGCGSCRMCRAGKMLDCPVFTFQGYFGRSRDIIKAYPYGGLSQYITAPVSAVVKLPDSVTYEQAARLGYLGTAYHSLKRLGVGPGQNLLVNGASGTLGLCAALLGLAMGATRILGVARNRELLERVRSLAPDRIFVYALDDDGGRKGGRDYQHPLIDWSRSITEGEGVDSVIDCLPPGAPSSAMLPAIYSLRRGGRMSNVGNVNDDLGVSTFWMITNRIGLEGSAWFTTEEGREIVAMAQIGSLDLSVFDHRVRPLSEVNEALAGMSDNKDGGFANYVIDVTRAA